MRSRYVTVVSVLPAQPVFFFFNDTATTEIYTLSLHDALPIYLPEVLLATEPVDDAPRAEEEERLEEGVRHEVEDAGRVRAESDGGEHVAQLAHGRVDRKSVV